MQNQRLANMNLINEMLLDSEQKNDGDSMLSSEFDTDNEVKKDDGF